MRQTLNSYMSVHPYQLRECNRLNLSSICLPLSIMECTLLYLAVVRSYHNVQQSPFQKTREESVLIYLHQRSWLVVVENSHLGADMVVVYISHLSDHKTDILHKISHQALCVKRCCHNISVDQNSKLLYGQKAITVRLLHVCHRKQNVINSQDMALFIKWVFGNLLTCTIIARH